MENLNLKYGSHPEAWTRYALNFLFPFLREHEFVKVEFDISWKSLKKENYDHSKAEHFYTFNTIPLYTLSSYAIENLIKACAVYGFFPNGIPPKYSGIIFSHDLVKVVGIIKDNWKDFMLPPNIENHISTLEEQLLWVSKYPVPKKNIPDGSKITWGSEQFETIRDTWDFFWSELQKRKLIVLPPLVVPAGQSSMDHFDNLMKSELRKLFM